MDDKAAKINERYQNLITLASTAVMMSPSEFGMVVLDDAMQGGASGFSRWRTACTFLCSELSSFNGLKLNP